MNGAPVAPARILVHLRSLGYSIPSFATAPTLLVLALPTGYERTDLRFAACRPAHIQLRLYRRDKLDDAVAALPVRGALRQPTRRAAVGLATLTGCSSSGLRGHFPPLPGPVRLLAVPLPGFTDYGCLLVWFSSTGLPHWTLSLTANSIPLTLPRTSYPTLVRYLLVCWDL